jgi:hypothetical protein
MIKNHLIGSLLIEIEDLQDSPFQQFGGIVRAKILFKEKLDEYIKELNGVVIS